MKRILLWNYFCIVIIIFLIPKVCSLNCRNKDEFEDAQIILSVSPLIGKIKREIGIYWHNFNFNKGDIVALYDKDPTGDNSIVPIYTHKPSKNSGFTETGVSADFNEEITFQEQCLSN